MAVRLKDGCHIIHKLPVSNSKVFGVYIFDNSIVYVSNPETPDSSYFTSAKIAEPESFLVGKTVANI